MTKRCKIFRQLWRLCKACLTKDGGFSPRTIAFIKSCRDWKQYLGTSSQLRSYNRNNTTEIKYLLSRSNLRRFLSAEQSLHLSFRRLLKSISLPTVGSKTWLATVTQLIASDIALEESTCLQKQTFQWTLRCQRGQFVLEPRLRITPPRFYQFPAHSSALDTHV